MASKAERIHQEQARARAVVQKFGSAEAKARIARFGRPPTAGTVDFDEYQATLTGALAEIVDGLKSVNIV